ncbi:hypothetical protein KAR91_49785 [Candidatus Pacearchaeota archaeon]|nr:hypothetical protein [Candidatus Pacearchaeota archaeon]
MLEQLTVVFYEVLPFVLAILLPMVFILVRGLLKKTTSKMDIETQVRLDQIIMNAVQQGVDYAEQWAESKQKLKAAKPNGQEKLRRATAYIVKELEEKDVQGITQEALERKVESILGSKKVGE